MGLMHAQAPINTAQLSAQSADMTIDPLTIGEQTLLATEPSDEVLDEASAKLLTPVIKAYNDGGYTKAKDVLAKLGKDLDAEQLSTVMGKALFLANLLGQSYAGKE